MEKDSVCYNQNDSNEEAAEIFRSHLQKTIDKKGTTVVIRDPDPELNVFDCLPDGCAVTVGNNNEGIRDLVVLFGPAKEGLVFTKIGLEKEATYVKQMLFAAFKAQMETGQLLQVDDRLTTAHNRNFIIVAPKDDDYDDLRECYGGIHRLYYGHDNYDLFFVLPEEAVHNSELSLRK